MVATPFVASEVGTKKIIAFLDGGSERSFISRTVADELELPRTGSETLCINAFGVPTAQAEERCYFRKVTIQGNQPGAEPIIIYPLDKIYVCSVQRQPATEFSRKLVRQGYPLADSRLESEEEQDQSVEVDLLIGTDLIWAFVNYQMQITSSCGLRAVDSKIGWLITGPHNEINQGPRRIIAMMAVSSSRNASEIEENQSISRRLEAFWGFESIGVVDDPISKEEEQLLEHTATIQQTSNGRYKTSLPWNSKKGQLPTNRSLCECRLRGQLRRLRRVPEEMSAYDQEIRQLIELGFVSIVPPTSEPVTYLPHHPVIRKDKTTTKIRPVFDGSAKTRDGCCLNDCLETGPNLNPDLLAVLLRFRQHRVAWTADIQKAFLMVELNEADSNTIRFLWVKHPDSDEVIELKWNRLPFGLNCSPYILRAVIQVHLQKKAERVPEAVKLILQALYVDDYITGADSVEEAERLIADSQQLFEEAGMFLRKWTTNIPELQRKIGLPAAEAAHLGEKVLHLTEDNKVLGMKWDTKGDVFRYDPTAIVEAVADHPTRISKRTLLRLSARVYDPMGLIAPTVLQLKMIFQKLWEHDCNSPVAQRCCRPS